MFTRFLHSLRLLSRFAAVLAFGVSGMARADDITVFAAASLKTALDQIAADFTAATGHRVTMSFAGSSVLARQIELGAPADLFISANPGWMEHLEMRGLLAPGTRYDIISNHLVLIAQGGDAAPVILSPDLDLPSLLGDGHLAMALVNAVPAGLYGKAALEHFDLWQGIAPRVAQTDNVRAALALVALGAAPYGITYATDAAAEPRVTIVATFPVESHPQILYPAAILAGRDTPATLYFLEFLTSAAAQNIFTAHGFEALK